MIELISTGMLHTSLDDFERYITPNINPLPYSTIDQSLNMENKESIVKNIKSRFSAAGEPNWIRQHLKNRLGVVGYYRKHHNVDWGSSLGKYMNGLLSRSNRDTWERSCVLIYDYIEKMITPFSPQPNSLKAEFYDYHCSSHFPFRDQILNLESTHIIGKSLLNIETISGETVRDLVIGNLINNDDFIKNVPNDWGKIHDEVSCYHLDVKKFWEMFGDKWVSLIDIAWELTSTLHEVGRYFDDEDVRNNNDPIRDHEDVEDLLANILGPTKQAIENNEYQHVAVNIWKLHQFASEKQLSNPIEKMAHYLVRHAMLCEFKCLVNMHDGAYDSDYAGPNIVQTWNDNIFGILLVIAKILAELPVRICWYSDDINLSADEWREKKVVSFMPVISLQLNKDGRQPFLVYKRDLSEYPTGVDFHKEPMDKPRQEIIKKVFGPECMKILDKDQAQLLKTVWDPPQSELQHKQEAIILDDPCQSENQKLLKFREAIEQYENSQLKILAERSKDYTKVNKSYLAMKEIIGDPIKKNRIQILYEFGKQLVYALPEEKRSLVSKLVDLIKSLDAVITSR